MKSIFALLPLISLAIATPVAQVPLTGSRPAHVELSLERLLAVAKAQQFQPGCHRDSISPAEASLFASIEAEFDAGRTHFLDNKAGLYKDFQFNPDEVRLIQREGRSPEFVTEWEKVKMKAWGINFFDMTDSRFTNMALVLRPAPEPLPVISKKNNKVTGVIETLSKANMQENLETFSGFRTRYYKSETGRQSQAWLLSRITQLTREAAHADVLPSITVGDFKHSWGQNSIIVSINGSTTPDKVVVIGAHQDSTNMFPFLPAPGADDDGSGSVTILEAYRALISSGFRPNNTVEFHWYSAEEGGLLGSQAVARDYAARGVDVIGMSQFDMTAWVKRGTEEAVGIIGDFVDPELTQLNKKLVDTYLDIPYVETKCGYACSDHASWTKSGYRSIFTIESTMEDSNKNIHSTNDRIDISSEFSFDHMLQFAKLAVAFASELGKWE